MFREDMLSLKKLIKKQYKLMRKTKMKSYCAVWKLTKIYRKSFSQIYRYIAKG